MGAAHVLDVDAGQLTTIVRPNSVNVLWQLPQYLVITMGEILFSVTGLEFSYSQASPSMKSVLQVGLVVPGRSKFNEYRPSG